MAAAGAAASLPAELREDAELGKQWMLYADHCERQLKTHEAIVASQIRGQEATFEQLLHQATGALRKDMVSREDRLSRRMDSERKEMQTLLFELRRDLTMQQTSDLAAHEDRLSRRLDGERREQKAAVAELRRDIGVHQEHRVQIANLRRDLGTTQAALSKLAQSRGIPAESIDSGVSKEAASALSDVAVSELKRELSSCLEQVQLQAAAGEASLANLRKELLGLQSEEMRSLQEQLGRSTGELARNLQEVMSALESQGNSLRADMRRDVDRLRADFETEKSKDDGSRSHGMSERGALTRRLDELERGLAQMKGDALAETTRLGTAVAMASSSPTSSAFAAESQDLAALRAALDETREMVAATQSQMGKLKEDIQSRSDLAEGTAAKLPADHIKELSTGIIREVERAERKLTEELLQKVLNIESTCHESADALKKSLAEAKAGIGRLNEDISRERGERQTGLEEVRRRVQDLAAATERCERKAAELSTAEFVSRASTEDRNNTQGTPSDVMDSVSERLVSKGFTVGSAEHVALAACVGELDAELRVELAERINTVISDLRREIDTRVGGVESELRQVSLPETFSKLQSRVEALEGSRLDLRLGKLESAAHHSANFTARGRTADREAQPEQEHGDSPFFPREDPSGFSMDPPTMGRMPSDTPRELDVSRAASEFHGASFEKVSRQGSVLGDSASQLAGGDSALEAAEARIEARLEARIEDRLDALLHTRSSPPGETDTGSMAGELGNSYALSDELKDRLEVLVQQVKMTLNRTGPGETPSQSGQVSQAGSRAASMQFSSLSLPQLREQQRAQQQALQAHLQYQQEQEQYEMQQDYQPDGQYQLQQGQYEQQAYMMQQPTQVIDTPAMYTSSRISLSRSMPFIDHQPSPRALATPQHPPPQVVHTPLAQTARSVIYREAEEPLPSPPGPRGPVQVGPAVLTEVRVSQPERRASSPLRAVSPVRRSVSPARRRDATPIMGHRPLMHTVGAVVPGQAMPEPDRPPAGGWFNLRRS